jgi:hypothetical protein
VEASKCPRRADTTGPGVTVRNVDMQEAYSVARQFNLIPPIAEQCEYSLLTREKVELQMPEMYHKIGAFYVLLLF